MVNRIEESKLSKTRNTCVQPLPGAKKEDLEANLDDLLHKDLEKVLLHARTKNAISDLPKDIFSKLISLVDSINCSLPKCIVYMRNLIKRTDNRKKNEVCEKVNTLLKVSNYGVLNVLNNSNIKEKHLGKRGFHLNAQSNAILASTFLNTFGNKERRYLLLDSNADLPSLTVLS